MHFFQPIDGVGKPEPLTHGLASYWLRRWGLNW
ncbi:type II toxin-antitoxin system YoeB family toxin [Halomonas titanicae]|nr:type II toxin-antitoxin system YoeB family toxin [Halomonas titanicae]